MPVAETPSPPTLRLVTGKALEVAVQPTLTRRPGDHLELISLDGFPLKPVRMAARERGLCPETGVALVLERALAVEQFRVQGLAMRLEHLEHVALEARAKVALWDAQSAYLRHLLGQAPTTRSLRPLDSPRAAVPVRLIDRLCDRKPRLGDDLDEELVNAVQWEIAAVVAGETMSEWAYRSALAAA